MVTARGVLSAEDIDVAASLAADLLRIGRSQEAAVVLKLIARAEIAEGPARDDSALTPEDLAAVERGEAQVAGGKVVPLEVVDRGPAAVAAYRRRRNGGAPAAARDGQRLPR